ncbi:MAG: hypothetical protein IJO33_01940 [Bacilli bacterium]|nr:hypothetical protein [Bacilli bacterium]
MSELISELINSFNTILNEQFSEIEENKLTVEQVKGYIKLIESDIYNIKDIDRYLNGVEISEEKFSLINQFKTTMVFNETYNVLTGEELSKYRKTSIYDYIKSALNRKINLLLLEKKENEIRLKNKRICLKLIKFLQKLDGNKIIGENQLYKLYNFLYSLNLPEEQLLSLNMMLLQYNLYADSKLELNSKEEIVENLSDINLTREEAIEIFNEYGYDFNLVDSKHQDDLLAMGTADGINSMFLYFKDILSTHRVYFDERNNTLVDLLFRSKPENFDEILDLCKGAMSLEKLLTCMPSIFINKGSIITTQTKNNKKTSKVSEHNDKSPSGSYEDFVMNLALFKELGYDIKEIIIKNADILTIPHERIKRNVEQFRLLGIDLRTNAKENFKLSALKSNSILLTLDKFIELGELEYIMANLSRFNLEPDSVVFYRLFHIKNYNRRSDNQIEIYHGKGKLMYKGYISNPSNNELGISEVNKYKGIVSNSDVSRYKVFNSIIEQRLQDIIDEAYSYKVVNIDHTIFENDAVKAIEGYKVNDFTYNIGGILISRHKFLRNYMAIANIRKDLDINDIVKYCLIKDSILTDNDIKKLEMAIIALNLSGLKR